MVASYSQFACFNQPDGCPSLTKFFEIKPTEFSADDGSEVRQMLCASMIRDLEKRLAFDGTTYDEAILCDPEQPQCPIPDSIFYRLGKTIAAQERG